MPKDPIAPIILCRPFLRIVMALINLHEGNMMFELSSSDPFTIYFPRKKKNESNETRIITLKANNFWLGIPVVKKSWTSP
jgi:hypothetical protein